MLRKYGIALITLVVAIVIITIISAVTVVSVSDTISETNFKTFVMELYNLQKLVDNYKMKNNGKLDFTTYTVKAKDYTGELKDVLETEGEIKREETVFYLLDENALEKLAIDKLTYGNQKYDETDIYAVSGTSGRVYYLYGYDFKETRYYYLTDGIITDIVLPNLDSEIASEILFIPSEFGKTREAVKVSVKVPRTVDISTVSVTTPGNSNPVISSYTMEGNYYVYTVNTNNWKGNYIVNVDYVENSENKTASYSVEEYLGVYALLYSDGELRINNTGKIDEAKIQAGNTVLLQSTDITDSTTIPWSSNATNINTVTFENEVMPTYVASWFSGCTNLTEINNMEFLDTRNVSNMSNLFYNCTSLRKADISNFNTQKVTNMTYMFYNCSSLEEIDVSNLNTQKVTNMNSMFRGCGSVIALDLSSFYSPKLTSMTSMFRDCKNLEELNMIGFSTPNRVSLETTFYNCNKLKALDLKGIVKISSLNATFNACSSIKELDLSHMDSAGMQHMMNAFNGCSALETLNLTGLNTSSLIGIQKAFAGCSNLTYVDVSTWNVSKVQNMNGVFSSCKKLQSIDLSNWTATAATNMQTMFIGCSALKSLDLKNFKPVNVENISQMFQRCEALIELDLSTWNITKLTSASQTFYYAKNLEYLDMRNVDFTTSTNYGNMFFGMPNGAILIVADDTQRTWLQSKISSAGNLVIKTASEL